MDAKITPQGGSIAREFTDSDVDLYAEYLDGQKNAGDEWYDKQQASGYGDLRKLLPIVFDKVMPPWGAAHPFIFNPYEVARKRNIVALHTPPKAERKGPPI